MATGKNKFFANSLESLSFIELADDTQIKMPSIQSEGTYITEAITSAGKFDTAFKVEQWLVSM
jgi:hypothetical protein